MTRQMSKREWQRDEQHSDNLLAALKVLHRRGDTDEQIIQRCQAMLALWHRIDVIEIMGDEAYAPVAHRGGPPRDERPDYDAG